MSNDRLLRGLVDESEFDLGARPAPGRSTLTQRLQPRAAAPLALVPPTCAPLDGAALVQRHAIQDRDLATAMGFFNAPVAPIQRSGQAAFDDDHASAGAA
jgi:hypothetical protein